MKKIISLGMFVLATAGALTAAAQNRDGTDIGSGGNGPQIVASQPVAIRVSRITERVVLFQEETGNTLVQLVAESQGGSTDFSNGLRLILSISAFGEMSGNEASFVVADAFKLNSARSLGNGLYEINYDDANSNEDGDLTEIRRIDARKALHDVLNTPCDEWEICAVNTTVEVAK